MNTRIKHIHTMVQKVLVFCTDHNETIAPGIKLAALLETLEGLNAELQQSGMMVMSGEADRGESVRDKQELAGLLRRMLNAFRTFAPVVEETAPEFGHHCTRPRSESYAALHQKCRVVLEILQPLETALIEAEMPADSISLLESTLEEFEKALETQKRSRSKRVEHNAVLASKSRAARAVVAQIDAVLHFKLRNEPDMLTAWKSARHVQRLPRSEKSVPTPPVSVEPVGSL